MKTKIAAVAPTPDPSMANVVPSVPPSKVAEAAAVQGADQVELRLVIEQDQASGSYVYKTINRLTGEVIQQLPRAEVLRLRDGTQYAAGSVVRTKA